MLTEIEAPPPPLLSNLDEQPSPIPEDEAMQIAEMSAITDRNLNGENALPPEHWLQRALEGKETDIRQYLADTKINKDIDSFVEGETTEPTAEPAIQVQVLNDLTSRSSSEEGRSILERETAKALINKSMFSDVRSSVIDSEELTDEDLAKLTDPVGRQESLTAALLLLNSEKGRYAREFGEAGVGETISEVFTLFLPYIDTLNQWLNGERKFETLGNALRRESDDIFYNIDPVAKVEEIIKKLDESDLPNLLKLDTLANKTIMDDEATVRSLFELIDIAGTGQTLRALTKIKRINRLSTVTKDPDAAAERTTEIVEKSSYSDKPLNKTETDELLESVIPSSSNSFVNGTSGKSARALEKHAAELEAIKTVKGQNFLSDEERIEAIKEIREDLISRLPKDSLVDVGTFDTDINRVTFKFGTGDEGLKGFASEEAAKAGALRLGLQEGFYDITKDGVYYVTSKFDVTPYKEGGKSILKGFSEIDGEFHINFVPQYLLGNRVNLRWNERVSRGGIVGVNASAKLNEVFKNTTKMYTKLGANSRQAIDEVMSHTQRNNEGRWLSMDSFEDWFQTNKQRTATDDEVTAYGSLIQLHQADEYISNYALRQEFIQRGFQEYGIMGVIDEPRIAKELTSFDRKNTKNVAIFDATNGKLYPKGETAGVILKKMEENDNLVLVKFLDEVKTKGGDKTQYVLVDKRGVSKKAIRSRVLNHFNGPHREYDSPHFMKQAVTDSEGTLTDVRTHFNVGSRDEGIKLADEYNEALEAFKVAEKAEDAGGATSANIISKATIIINKNTPYASYDEMKEAIAKGKLSRTPFEVWRDKGDAPLNDVTKYNSTNKDSINPEALDIDEDMVNFSARARQYIDQGRLYYSARGDHLKDPYGKLAKVAGHNEILENSIKHIINTRSFGEFKSRNTQEWVQTYKQYLQDGDLARPDWWFFTHGKFKTDGVPSGALAQAERTRTGLKRILHARSDMAKDIENYKYKLHEYTLSNKGSLKGLGSETLEKALDNNWIDGLRGITFKLFLGLGDISQVIVQTSMIPVAAAVAGRQGVQALAMLPLLRMSEWMSNPKALEFLAAKASKIGSPLGVNSIEPRQVRELMEDIRDSGAHVVNGTQAELDSPFDGNRVFGPSALGRLGEYSDKALDAGLVFFKEGEKLNQMAGFTMAWLEHYTKTGKRPVGDALEAVLSRAEIFAGNMKSSSRAAYQSGPASIPMQFAAHPIRVAEQILFKQADGLTGAERLRFGTSIAVLYGTAGLGIDSLIEGVVEKYEEVNEVKVDGPTRKIIANGVIGGLFEGTDIGRMQPLRDNIISEILTNFEDLKLTDFGGPSGSLVGDWMETVGGSLLLRGLAEGTLSPSGIVSESGELLKEIFLSLPAPSRYDRAWSMHLYNANINKSGKLLEMKEYTTLEKTLTAAGFPPIHSDEVYKATLDMKDIKRGIKTHVTFNKDILLKAILTNDKDTAKALYTRISAMTATYQNQKPHVYREYTRQMASMLKSINKQATKENLKRLYNFFSTEYVNTKVRGN
jgi:hypothetical protein